MTEDVYRKHYEGIHGCMVLLDLYAQKGQCVYLLHINCEVHSKVSYGDISDAACVYSSICCVT